MQALEMEKHRVDLSKRGCVPATNFNARWACDYGTHGMSAVAHNYYTSKGALIKVYDIYHNGVYETSFDTKKVAMGYLESREKGFEMQEGKSKLKDRVKEVVELNKQMHADIVEFLKQHNGLVRTDNTERRDMGLSLCDNIYTISMDGDDEPNTEKRVLAVALFGEDQVAVLPDLSDNETILGMTDQEVLDCDNWEWVYGGYTLQNATLTSICECIEEYV
jgi:hypothetical protein